MRTLRRPNRIVARETALVPARTATALPTPTAAAASMIPRSTASPTAMPPPQTHVPNSVVVPVRAQRLNSSRWALRWSRPKGSVTKYRAEERILSLDGAGELQTPCHQLAAPEIANSGDSLITQINVLDPQQLHTLRVTALRADGTNLWESPLVALSPPRGSAAKRARMAADFGDGAGCFPRPALAGESALRLTTTGGRSSATPRFLRVQNGVEEPILFSTVRLEK